MKKKVTIYIGCDHAGFPYKQALIELLTQKGYQVEDQGTHAENSVDYPDYVHPVAQAVQSGTAKLGIIMCGSGNGVAMTANKYKGVRAAICWEKELAELARQHNDANIISIPVRFVSQELALEMIKTFLDTDFEGGRHQRRVSKIDPQG